MTGVHGMGLMSGMGEGPLSPFGGFASLAIGMALSMVAMTVLRSAGARKGRGEPWQGPAMIGGAMLLGGAGAALTALGSFFGFMGVLFAVFFLMGGVTSFGGAAQAEQRRREDVDLVREFNASLRQGHQPPPAPGAPPSRGATLNGEPLPGTDPAGGGRREPDWYQSGGRDAEGDRPSS